MITKLLNIAQNALTHAAEEARFYGPQSDHAVGALMQTRYDVDQALKYCKERKAAFKRLERFAKKESAHARGVDRSPDRDHRSPDRDLEAALELGNSLTNSNPDRTKKT